MSGSSASGTRRCHRPPLGICRRAKTTASIETITNTRTVRMSIRTSGSPRSMRPCGESCLRLVVDAQLPFAITVRYPKTTSKNPEELLNARVPVSSHPPSCRRNILQTAHFCNTVVYRRPVFVRPRRVIDYTESTLAY